MRQYLERLNKSGRPGYADGGYVGLASGGAASTGTANTAGSVVIQQNFTVPSAANDSSAKDMQTVGQAYADTAKHGAQQAIAEELRPGGAIWRVINGRRSRDQGVSRSARRLQVVFLDAPAWRTELLSRFGTDCIPQRGWLLHPDYHFHPVIHPIADPNEEFRIAPEDFAAAEDLGAVIGIVHSHPDATSRPSPRDLAMCEATELPWH
nr:hypothetical protein [Tanacetum cinerariifolium]